MDAFTIATNILTGVATAVVVGVFGVRAALKQFKLQRGFERRLDWYEKTAEAIYEYGLHNATIVFALKNNRPDLLEEASKNAMPLKEFQKTLINDSLLYAERKLYLRLKEVGTKTQEITQNIHEVIRTGAEPTELYESNGRLLEEALFELSQPIRKMLDLKKLYLADFEKSPP